MGAIRRFGAALAASWLAATVVAVGPAGASPVCKGLAVTIAGSPRPDHLEGTAGRDVIHAGPGDDVVLGRGGRDVVCGGPGSDVVSGGGGADGVFGSEDADVVSGGPGNDFVSGGKGHDVADFGSARRALIVDLRRKVATGQGFDRLDAIESAAGGDGHDVVRGTRKVNLLVGGLGDDRLLGLGGTDVLQPLEGDDVADGGPGRDLLSYSLSAGAVSIDPNDGDGTERVRSIEGLQGSHFPDVITGTNGDDVLLGGLGGDQFRGGPGDDLMSGEGPASDIDVVVYDAAPRRVRVALQAVAPGEGRIGEATGQGKDVLVKIDGAVGSRYADVMVGRSGPDEFAGLGGDDRIDIVTGGSASGGDGADLLVGTGLLLGDDGDDELKVRSGFVSGELHGGAGDDVLVGSDDAAETFVPGPGDDVVTAQGPSSIDSHTYPRQDTVSYAGAANGVVVDLGRGMATGEGTDSLGDVEDVQGSPFDDVITGNESYNRLWGGAGSDRLDALAAGDLVEGGPGDDTMTGGDGDDALSGGDGVDGADGGAGHDVCDAEQVASCESAPTRRDASQKAPRVTGGRARVATAARAWRLASQASRWERHLRKISQAMTESGNVTSPTSPISEFRNRNRLIHVR